MQVGAEVEDTDGQLYRVVEQLGAGGQGTAFKVADRSGRHDAVLKVFDPVYVRAHPETMPRMSALASLRLSSRSEALRGAPRSVLRGTQPGYLAGFCDGEPLLAYIERHPGDLPITVALGAALSRAVALAEEHGVAHGDLSPANVLVLEDAARVPRVRLIDFDAACIPGAEAPPRIGTPLYRAPEIIDGSTRPSVLSDRFSLGVMLHEMLLARHPWGTRDVDPDDDAAQLAVIRSQQFVGADDHEAAGGVPASVLGVEIRRMLRRSMSVRGADRPSAAEWYATLRAALAQLWECPVCQFITRDELERNGCPACGEPPSPMVLESSHGVRIALRPPTMLLGRAALCADESVSERHFVFRPVGFRWFVRDVSRNGTYFLGDQSWVRVPHGHEIEVRAGDSLRAGRSIQLRLTPG